MGAVDPVEVVLSLLVPIEQRDAAFEFWEFCKGIKNMSECAMYDQLQQL